MTPPLQYLKAFLALGRQLSFSKAAQELGISQPSLSRQIRLMEEEMGIQLVLRDRQNVALSNSGQTLYDRLSPLYEQIIENFESALNTASSLKGQIRVASLAEFGKSKVAPLLTDFINKYPEIEMDLKLWPEDIIENALKAGHIDFGILTNPLISESLRSHQIFEETVVLIARKGLKEDLETRKEIPLVCYTRSDDLHPEIFKTKKDLNRVHPVFFLNDFEAIARAILQTDFYAVIPEHTFDVLLNKSEFEILASSKVVQRIYLVYRDVAFMDKKSLVLKDFFLEHFS